MKSPYDTAVGIFSHLNIAGENNISLFRKAIYPLGVIVNKADRKMHGMLRSILTTFLTPLIASIPTDSGTSQMPRVETSL